jgi:hypothetical protein
LDNIIERFWDKVETRPSGCWEWTAYITSEGYGQFYPKHGNPILAHRFSYETNKGKIPKVKEIDHLCRNRKCVNPEHLECVTRRVNISRGMSGMETGLRNLAKTHCPKGHPYSGDNLYIIPSTGTRQCRTCVREAHKKK